MTIDDVIDDGNDGGGDDDDDDDDDHDGDDDDDDEDRDGGDDDHDGGSHARLFRPDQILNLFLISHETSPFHPSNPNNTHCSNYIKPTDQRKTLDQPKLIQNNISLQCCFIIEVQ